MDTTTEKWFCSQQGVTVFLYLSGGFAVPLVGCKSHPPGSVEARLYPRAVRVVKSKTDVELIVKNASSRVHHPRWSAPCGGYWRAPRVPAASNSRAISKKFTQFKKIKSSGLMCAESEFVASIRVCCEHVVNAKSQSCVFVCSVLLCVAVCTTRTNSARFIWQVSGSFNRNRS